MSYCQKKISSPVGDLYLLASPKGLSGVYWSMDEMEKKLQEFNASEDKTKQGLAQKHLEKAQGQLQAYFEGKLKDFDLDLDYQEGTDFQKKVWQQLRKIPYGKTCSYKDLAAAIKNEKAVRAVGSANGKNPFSIIIPCHRVISADGSLGGYAGGLKIKKALLELEA